MVRKGILLALIACWCLARAVPSQAGIAHCDNQLVCSDCHTMHYSEQHNYRGGTTTLVVDPSGPFDKLLKASPNNLCLACHDSTGTAPDVLGVNDGGYVRQAGGLTGVGTQLGYQAWMGHTLGSTATAPGGTWADTERGLLCIDCHDPHGIKSQWRNLWTSAVVGDKFQDKTVTFSFGFSTNTAKDVFLDVNDGLDIATKYSAASVHFNEPDSTKSAYANWCASCHGEFHGSGGSANMGGASGGDPGSSPWKRHPTADVNIGQNSSEVSSLVQYQSHLNRAKTMSHSGDWDSGSDVTPSCFSCHKAHGNKNAFGLIYTSGTGTVSEEGDSGGSELQDLCRQCHAQ